MASQQLYLIASLLSLSIDSSAQSFTIKGNKVYKDDDWIVFNGIGLSCTEYGQANGRAPTWFYQQCFGGPIDQNNGNIQLNQEPYNIINIFKTKFNTNPQINKVKYSIDYFNEVVDLTEYPKHHPIVRMPTTGSSYLYDEETCWNNASIYRDTLDKMIAAFTSNGIAVSFDMHWSCASPTNLTGCIAGNQPMPYRYYGSKNGTLAFWGAVSKKYANNPYVFYEIYNEPHLKKGEFDTYYNGNDTYVGFRELYDLIRRNDPNGIIILGGMLQYAFDSPSQIAFYLQFKQDTGNYPTNIIYNFHPYQANPQGVGSAPQGAMLEMLSSKTIGPIFFSEFGQACCNDNGITKDCTGAEIQCDKPNTAPNFDFNIVNMAAQFDISWTPWTWRGTNGLKCDNHEGGCMDLRGAGYPNATLTDGLFGGANWTLIWDTFVNTDIINVYDTLGTNASYLGPNDKEPRGYLPRPCILGTYSHGNNCGFDLGIPVSNLNVTSFNDQSGSYDFFAGIPPAGNCSLQGCPGLNKCSQYKKACPPSQLIGYE